MDTAQNLLALAKDVSTGLGEIAPVVGGALKFIGVIVSQAANATANKKKCKLLSERLMNLNRPLEALQKMNKARKDSLCRGALKTIVEQIVRASEVIDKYAAFGGIRKFVQASGIREEFLNSWEGINAAVADLQFALATENAQHNEDDTSDSQLAQLSTDMEEQTRAILQALARVEMGQRDQAAQIAVLQQCKQIETQAAATTAQSGVNVTEQLRSAVCAQIDTRVKQEKVREQEQRIRRRAEIKQTLLDLEEEKRKVTELECEFTKAKRGLRAKKDDYETVQRRQCKLLKDIEEIKAIPNPTAAVLDQIARMERQYQESHMDEKVSEAQEKKECAEKRLKEVECKLLDMLDGVFAVAEVKEFVSQLQETIMQYKKEQIKLEESMSLGKLDFLPDVQIVQQADVSQLALMHRLLSHSESNIRKVLLQVQELRQEVAAGDPPQ